MNILKEKLSTKNKLFGTHLSMGETYVADIFGQLGYDFVWIDTEHSCMDYGQLLNCITILKAHKTPVIVRLHMDDFNHTKRVLEMGPDGVIFPMVDTVEYADKCMKSTLYPPLGNRGFGPQLAVNYGLKDMNEYIQNQEKNLCRFIQIETATAVKNLPELIKNPYIDGCIFGPCDLSGSIGKLNDVFCEENISLIKEAIAILKKSGKRIGLSTGSTDPNVQKYWLDLGVDMLSAGTDYKYVLNGAKSNIEGLKKLQ